NRCACWRSTPISVSLPPIRSRRSEEHTSELQSLAYLVCRLLLSKKTDQTQHSHTTARLDTLTSAPSRRTSPLYAARVYVRIDTRRRVSRSRCYLFFFFSDAGPPE